MLFGKGPHLNLYWFTPFPIVLAVIVSTVVKCFVPLSFDHFAVVLIE
jgi:hypothetical protein